MPAKTGGLNGAWVALEAPKPTRVDRYRYWGEQPPEPSARCLYWVRQIERGWRPNRFVRRMGYDCSAEWYGVYIWEWLNALQPYLAAQD